MAEKEENNKIVPVIKTIPVTKSQEGGLPITSSQSVEQKIKNGFDISQYFHTAGQVKLTKEQKTILFDPVAPEEIEIRPDGLIYLPWTGYAKKLRDAFGLEWTLLPQSLPILTDNFVLWEFWLIIQGKLAGFAIGEQNYYRNNSTMSWADACEGAKSNALMRLCKGLGIESDLWTPSFIKKWKKENTESHWCINTKKPNDKKKLIWIKKGEQISYPYEKSSYKKPSNTQVKTEPPKEILTKAEQMRFDSMLKSHLLTGEERGLLEKITNPDEQRVKTKNWFKTERPRREQEEKEAELTRTNVEKVAKELGIDTLEKLNDLSQEVLDEKWNESKTPEKCKQLLDYLIT